MSDAHIIRHADGRVKHGGRNTRLYRIWWGMKSRCYWPGSETYLHYGGRGIKVCDEWNESFASFRDWALANGYAEHLTIDRKDNDGNYEPLNCRWATGQEQMQNRTSSRKYIFQQQLLTVAEIARRVGVTHGAIQLRIDRRGIQLGSELPPSITGPRTASNGFARAAA